MVKESLPNAKQGGGCLNGQMGVKYLMVCIRIISATTDLVKVGHTI
jgi:hypothetical protein